MIFKKFSKFFSFIALGFFTLLFFTPLIISTKSGQKYFLNFISVSTRSTIEADKLSLSWISGQSIHRLRIKNHLIDLYIEQISSPDSLFKALFQGIKLKKIIIQNPEGIIKIGKNSSNTLAIPFDELLIQQANIQFLMAQKTYKFSKTDLSWVLNPQTAISFKGLLGLGLDTGSFEGDLLADKNTIFRLGLKTNKLPTELFRDLLPDTFFNNNLIDTLGSSFSLDTQFNRQDKILNFDLKTQNGYGKFDNAIAQALVVRFEKNKNVYSIAGKNIAIDFDNLKDSTGEFDFDLADFSYESLIFKTIKTKMVSTKENNLSLKGSLQSDTLLKGAFIFDASLEKDFSKLALLVTTHQFSFKDPLIGVWKSLPKAILNLTFQDQIWNGIFEVKTIQGAIETPIIQSLFQSEKVKNLTYLPRKLNVKIDSPFLKTSLDLDLKDPIKTVSPTYFTLEIPNEYSKVLFPQLRMKNTLLINGMLEKQSSIYELKGLFSIQNLEAYTSNGDILKLILQKGEFSIDPKKNSFEINLFGTCNEGSFTTELYKDSKTEYKAKSQFTNLPVEIIDLFKPTDQNIKNLIGSSFSGTFNLQDSKDIKLIDAHIQTQKGNIRFVGKLDESTFSITKPLKMNLVYSNKNSNNWFQKEDLFLVSEPKIELDLQEFSIPTNLDFNQVALTGKYSISDLKFYSNHEVATIEKLNGDWKKRKNEPLFSTFKTTSNIGKIDSSLMIQKIRLDKPSEILPSFSGTFNLQVIDVPTIFFRAFLAPFINKDLALLLGDQFNLQFLLNTQEIPKTCELTLNSGACNLVAKGRLEGKDFILTKPLVAEIKAEEGFKQLFFEATGIHLIYAKAPFIFEAASRGFILPLDTISITSMQAPFFALDLGQIEVQNDGTMDLASVFFKKKFSNTIRLWFAPIECQLKNGLLNLTRTEVLIAPNLPVAFWGKIDFKKQYVDLTLGLSAASLKATLGISGLPSNFVLTIPVRGPFNQVKVDKGSAITKITTLIAAGQGFTGQLGGVLGLMNQMMNDQGSIPKPKRPFPWEKPTSYLDLQTKKEFLLNLKNHQKEEELISYSLSIDPLIRLIQEQINTLTQEALTEPEAAATEEAE